MEITLAPIVGTRLLALFRVSVMSMVANLLIEANALRRILSPTLMLALEPLERPMSPLTLPKEKRDTTWVEPRFEVEITYSEVTNDGMVRQPSFKALLRRR